MDQGEMTYPSLLLSARDRWESWPQVVTEGELAVGPTSCSTQESRLSTSPGQGRRPDPAGGGVRAGLTPPPLHGHVEAWVRKKLPSFPLPLAPCGR